MDYSKTVNLPTTEFPMKANLPQREPELLKQWEDGGIYETILNNREKDDLYILHDGPPYANGHIHLGHALNKILKDIIVKHKSMMGFRAPYVPGWDCHGLPIELSVTRELGDRAKDMPKVDIRKRCRAFAEEFVRIQMEEFKRLGVFGDYENPYKTLTPEYEAKIVEVFGKLFQEGYIFKSKKPIYWCPTCVTALAEAEVEYGDHTSPSVYVKFKVDPESISLKGIDRDRAYVVIWTTTPWTLPANLAVCFHPDLEYSMYDFGGDYYLIAKGLADRFEEIAGPRKGDGIDVPKEAIEKMKVRHPFIDRESKVIFGDHVTMEQGTGVVHTAPGHGYEDYLVGLQYGLDVYCPVDDEGRFTGEFPEMKGINVFDANDRVVDLLKKRNVLIHTHKIEHSYPHCWRCKKPLIFRATEQWFFSIDHRDLRKRGLKAVDDTKWIPSWGETRFRSMVETRPDWCLSRQRSWGVPIPSFRCAKCEQNMMSAESIAHFSGIALERGIDTWYTDNIADLVPAGTKCKCGSGEFVKEFDILDVWFDSGVSHFAVLESWKGHRWPADLYLEGSDQHRGWFQSSLWPAVALRDRAPYGTVLTHGFVLDEEGKAMSKSQGNVIPPEDLIKKYGADILRLWVSSEDYRNDVRIGMNMMQQTADSYRKIRNTFKFILGNISDFDEAKNSVAYDELPDLDKWTLHQIYVLSEKVLRHYENFEFHMVYRRIVNFCAVELSSIYFDLSKDILYIERKNSKKRRANQTVLNEIYKCLAPLIAPILAFTAEEIWRFNGLHSGSVHTERYYRPDNRFFNEPVASKIDDLVKVKSDVLKALELVRKDKTIKTSLEADISIYVESESVRNVLREMGDDLKRFLQAAKAEVPDEKSAEMEKFDAAWIVVKKSAGKKCVRCWNYYDTLGTDKDHPEICQRCTDIIRNMDTE